MKINIFSYKDAEVMITRNNSYRNNWISIRDIGFEYLYNKMDELCDNVLILKFDDVTNFDVKHNLLHPFYQRISEKRNFVHFNEEMAIKILKFTNKLNKNDTLNIHCWAGKSRSQAIGYCLNQYYNLFMDNNEEDFIRNLQNSIDGFVGNSDVIKVMSKTLYYL
jgi:predicted protein tyrosine phosphatase